MILETTLLMTHVTHTVKLKKTDTCRATTKRRGVEDDDNDLRDCVKRGKPKNFKILNSKICAYVFKS